LREGGLYFFSKPLEDKEIRRLIDKSATLQLGVKRKKIWAYRADDLKLINNVPFSTLHEAELFFKASGMTINRHTDTKEVTSRNRMRVYFFSSELSPKLRDELMKGSSLQAQLNFLSAGDKIRSYDSSAP
jgi:hypothetical protein